ncbi:MAG: hypothetical protein JST28_02520 [Acidobacteria bacterium]|nr:hypothetical protein [Acidobacteriota bacterium]
MGVLLGWFLNYASAVDHPVSQTPIPVDFCFWASHPELFHGQPVLTEAKYIQLVETGAIERDECQNLDISNYWSQTNDPVRDAWEKDLYSNFFTAQFDLSFIGTIPAHPRYFYWLADARDLWRPSHKITAFRVDKLTSFRRLR